MGQEGKDALKDFKEFWAKYNDNKSTGDNKIHLDDLDAIPEEHRKTIDSDTKENDINNGLIITNARPDPCCGDIENAKFIILSRNPGFGTKNFEAKAYLKEKEKEQRNPAKTQNPNVNRERFDYLYTDEKHKGASKYWHSKFKRIITECTKELKDERSKSDVKEKIAEATCLLESVCYASNSGPKTDPETLQSSILIQNLLHKYLIPKAEAGKILIFSWRDSKNAQDLKFWNIEEKYIDITVKEFGQSPQNKFDQERTEIQLYIGENIIIRGSGLFRNAYFPIKASNKIAEFLIKAIREDQQNT